MTDLQILIAMLFVLGASVAGVFAVVRRALRHRALRRRAASPPLSSPPAMQPPRASVPDFGVVYIDGQGACTLADPAARQLLGWGAGPYALLDLLPGHAADAAQVLEVLARRGTVERSATTPNGFPGVHIQGVAMRDRDDHLWGAALFLERQ